MPRPVAILLALALGACSPGIPQLGLQAGAAQSRAPFPQLQPLDVVLAAADGGTLSQDTGGNLQARAVRLRRRARTLTGPVLDRASRARLSAAIFRYSR